MVTKVNVRMIEGLNPPPPDSEEGIPGIIPIATQDMVDAGTDDASAITPLKLKEKPIPPPPDSEEGIPGIIPIATQDMVDAGTDDASAITPLKLKEKPIPPTPNATATVVGGLTQYLDVPNATLYISFLGNNPTPP